MRCFLSLEKMKISENLKKELPRERMAFEWLLFKIKK
jgi:hypothetical protein